MNVVLFEPEIPANTGNIARLCVGVGASLHLVRPLGFFLSDKQLQRAGLDYWEHLNLVVHDSWQDFSSTVQNGQIYLVETGGEKLYTQPEYTSSDYLVFGSETKGLPQSILNELQKNVVVLPQKTIRSQNLANTVAIVLYEAWRQLGFE